MHRRLIAAALLAAALATAACQSTADSGGSSSGSPGGGSSTGGGAGVASAAPNGDTGHGPYSSTFDGCTVFFGARQASSDTYIVSASREGIGGQAGWNCRDVAGVDHLQLTAYLEHSLTLTGPWAIDPEPSSTATTHTSKRAGALFPYNTTCTTDWWRISIHIEWDETGGGHMTRPDLHSQPRKVADEDCNRR